MIRVAVMGYGTIGSGVVEVLDINKNSIAKRAGEEIGVKYILDLRDFPGDPIQEKVVHDYKVIANDPEVQIVVETMGGVEPAYTFVKAMLTAGKHVTTSNKALVAAKGAELIALAKEKNVNFMFEASVGGGIPIIRPLNSCLTADEIEEITGIVNGTTNYMLTKMTEEGSEFDDVLKDAQAKGYAEKDPTADIEGYDACRKIAILTSLVCGQQVDFEDIHTEGITKITATDIRYAKAMGRAIKLLASSHKVGDGYVAMVAPFLLPAIQCQRCVQCHLCTRQCARRCHVLRKRRRQAPDGERSCGGYRGYGEASGHQYRGGVELQETGAGGLPQRRELLFCAHVRR